MLLKTVRHGTKLRRSAMLAINSLVGGSCLLCGFLLAMLVELMAAAAQADRVKSRWTSGLAAVERLWETRIL